MTGDEPDADVVVPHHERVVVRLPDDAQTELVLWIEEEPSVRPDDGHGTSPLPPAPRRRGSRSLGLPPFKPARVPVSLTAEGVSVAAPVTGGLTGTSKRRPRPLVEDVSFAIEPGRVVALIGPSGAGKTSLMRAVSGDASAEGIVRYNGVPLTPETVGKIRRQIAYVPQADTLHTSLTLREALSLSAQLRLPHHTPAQRDLTVERLMAELVLTEQADVVVASLSGGERKRASVALELMTEPAVLFLDEPTTGLDPDAERLLVDLIKRLAVEGRRTILMVTHSPAALQQCDLLLVVAKGGAGVGRTAFFGPPSAALRFFGVARGDFAGIYERVRDRSTDWPALFRHSTHFRRNVVEAIERGRPMRGLDTTQSWARPARQAWLLARRTALVVQRQQQYAQLLIWQAPIVVVLLLLFLGLHNLDAQPDSRPRSLLAFTAVAALAMGLVNANREIVKEQAIVQRERTVGMSLPAYLASKVLVLSGLALAQAVVLTAVFFWQDGLQAGLITSSRLAESVVILFLTITCATAGGLAISAVVSSDSTALVLLPILLVAQLLVCGAFLEVEGRLLLMPLAYLTPAYWSFSALAASNDLERLEGLCGAGAQSPVTPPPVCGDLWSHDVGDLRLALAALLVLTAVYLAGAGQALRRKDPVR